VKYLKCRGRYALAGERYHEPQAGYRHGRRCAGLPNAVVCSRVHEPKEALSAATIALEISSRNSRVAARQNRWDCLRAGLDLILDQRGADMADLPGGASGLLVRDSKRKEAAVSGRRENISILERKPTSPR
jgi:hypothetical protein